MRRRRARPAAAALLALAVVAVVVLLHDASPAPAAKGVVVQVAGPVAGPPRVIAAAGDSFNTGFAALPHSGDHPTLSWSTGSDPSVDSIYDRLLPADPALRDHEHLVAVDGSKIGDLPDQFARAASFHAQLVTVQSGGNDVCDARGPATLTSSSSFRSSVEQAFEIARTRMPDARIFITSLTDEARWNDRSATIPGNGRKLTDGTLCDPLITNGVASSARRLQIQRAEQRYNAILRQVCATDPLCRYDGDAFFRLEYRRGDIAATNAFHPSAVGLRHMASTAWAAGFDFADVTPPGVSAVVRRVGSTLHLTLHTTDAHGISGIECRSGAGAYARCGRSMVLADGSRIAYRAVDRDGNISAAFEITG